MEKLKKIVLISIGMLSFLLGVIGVAIPVLPTAPFLLLASFCFVRGSEKFDKWLKSTKIYKKHMESFVDKKEMTLRQKIYILFFTTIMISIPIFLIDSIHMRIFLILLILFKFYYFTFKISTVEETVK